MEFTREKTNVAKGIAILLMFSNHLYAFPDRLLHGNFYIPLIPTFNVEFLIGNFGSVCVSIFLFLSGYGMYIGYKNSRYLSLRYSLNKLKDFYLTYWLYFLVFVPIGLFFFQNETLWYSSEKRYSLEILDLLEGFSGWSARYNSEWWFVRMFVLMLLLLCPLYLSLANRNLSTLCLISSTLFLLAWISKVDYTGLFGIFFWQINFFMGILFARLNLYASPFFSRLDRYPGIFILLLGLLFDEIFFLLRSSLGAKVDFLFVA
ncbi:MAG: acyltransferase family protein, partial [Leptolyngbyaceae cyanobacterium bins.59]|nr:acyltransferase family protein [Leptolyngbyaceae cyanobacterium bins.59]